MGFNWENAAYGFGYGALSGYNDILKQKRQEEYEQRKEEAQMQRQKSLAMWQEQNINAPRRAEERTNQLADIQSQRTYENDPSNFKNKLALDQFAETKRSNLASEADRAASRGIQERSLSLQETSQRDQAQLRGLQVQEAQIRLDDAKASQNDPMYKERKANEIFATELYKTAIEKGTSESEAQALRLVAKMSGAKTQAEFNEINKKSDGALKEAYNLGSKVAEDTTKRISETLSMGNDGKSSIIQEATSIVGRPVSLEEAKQVIVSDRVKTAVSSYTETFSKGSPAPKATSIDPNLNQQQINYLIEKSKSSDPKDQANVNNYIKQIEAVDPKKAKQIRSTIQSTIKNENYNSMLESNPPEDTYLP